MSVNSIHPEKHAQWEADRGRIKARKASSRQVPMQVILEQLQSPHLLRSWLQTKPPNEIAGAAQTPDETVLANFLWETLGIYVIAFGVELWPLDGDRWNFQHGAASLLPLKGNTAEQEMRHSGTGRRYKPLLCWMKRSSESTVGS